MTIAPPAREIVLPEQQRAEPNPSTTGLNGPPTLPPGTELAPGYTVVEHLRRGRDIDAYDAWSHDRRCRCVIKAIRPDRADDRHSIALLRREGRLLLSLTHPHLVRAYELVRGDAARPPALVLEVLSGMTLSYLLDEEVEKLPGVALGYLGRHLCSALHYLHGRGYLHLDVKPSNVIADEGRAKLIDLGLARRPGPCPSGLGTRIYMSPEQAAGDEVGPAADVWGVGLTLYQAATGHHPFLRHQAVDLPATASGERPEPLQLTRRAPRVRARRRLPVTVAGVLDACLEPDPAARPTLDQLDTALTMLTPDTD